MEQAQSPFEELRPQNPTVEYAGFWMRFVAAIIDGLILSPIGLILNYALGIQTFQMPMPREGEEFSFDFSSMIPGILLSMALYWLYYALLESSAKQATVGKMALKLKVTDMHGQRISLGKATVRFFSKYIISQYLTIGIGYIMAAFTDKKQALHNIIASTLVVKKNDDVVEVSKEEETY